MKKLFVIIIACCLIQTAVNSQNKPDSLVAKNSGPGTYKILKKDSGLIRIPFKMHNGKPLMDLEINGKKATLMIDNGILWDQVWLLGSPLVDELGLKPIEESTIGGTGEGDPTQAYTAKNLTLKFQDIEFYEQPVLVSPTSAGFAKAFPGADGQLCNTFFKHFIVEFDFIKMEILLHDPKSYKYNETGSILDMKLNETGTYSIPFDFVMPDGKEYKDRIDIDLGGIYPLKIALNNKHNIPLPSDVKTTFSYGIQGKTAEYRGVIQSMTIGKYRFENPTAIFGDEKTSRVHPNNLGVIGLPLFMKFNTIFDYFNNKLFLIPNKNFTSPFEN
ncbi:MAG: hypothetical protein WCK84_12110 [Bacteroidota bacterium]